MIFDETHKTHRVSGALVHLRRPLWPSKIIACTKGGGRALAPCLKTRGSFSFKEPRRRYETPTSSTHSVRTRTCSISRNGTSPTRSLSSPMESIRVRRSFVTPKIPKRKSGRENASDQRAQKNRLAFTMLSRTPMRQPSTKNLHASSAAVVSSIVRWNEKKGSFFAKWSSSVSTSRTGENPYYFSIASD